MLFNTTDLGKREKNQDASSAFSVEYEGNAMHVAIAADGVGSFRDSEIASGFAVKFFERFFEEKKSVLFSLGFDDLELELFSKANELHERLKYIAETKGYEYGTTLTLALTIENSYIVIQVGDSRCYLYQNSYLKKITKDQNVKMLKEEGRMEDSNAKDNALLQCLGRGEMVPKLYDGILEDKFTLLVCTDGLTSLLSFDEITKTLSSNQSLEGKIKSLIERSRRKGEEDNISACVISKEG